jgi:transcriptional regulator with XRE-family HTH domain
MQAERSKLAAVLDRNRLQQKHVALALGVTRMTVLAWFHGRSVPTGDNLARLLVFLRRFEPGLQNEDILGAADAEGLVVGGSAVEAVS